ncbi:hypothetical protein FF1_016035 [Malus domestica]
MSSLDIVKRREVKEHIDLLKRIKKVADSKSAVSKFEEKRIQVYK